MGNSIKTLVAGASLKPYRYSYRAVKILKINGHEVIALGRTPGEIDGITIETSLEQFEDIHTISMYLNPENQKSMYKYFLSLKPKRIIFNPGSENPEFEKLANSNGILTENACTLVLLSIGEYDKLML